MSLLMLIKLGFWFIGMSFILLWTRFMYDVKCVGNRMGFLPGNSLISIIYSFFFKRANSHLLRAATLTLAADAAYALLLLIQSFDDALDVFAGVFPSAGIFCTVLVLFSFLGKQGMTQKLSSRLSVSYDRKNFFGRERVIAFHLIDPDFNLTTASFESSMQEIASTALAIRKAGANEGFIVRSWLLAPAKSRKNKKVKKFQKIFRSPKYLMDLHPGIHPKKDTGKVHKLPRVLAIILCMSYLSALRALRIWRARDNVPTPTETPYGLNKAMGIVQKNFPRTKINALPMKKIAIYDAIHIVGHAPEEWQKLNAWTAGFDFS